MPQYRRPLKNPINTNGIALGTILVMVIILLSLFNILGGFGRIISNIVSGLLGFSAYAVTVVAIIIAVMKLMRKRIFFDRKKALRYLPLLLIGILAIHTLTTQSYPYETYGDYLKQCYINGSSNAGGLVFAVILYPLFRLGVTFTLSFLVIAFFSVAFISLYPLFLSNNYQTKRVKYKKLNQGNNINPVAEEVGNELFIGSPDGKNNNNKIYRKSAFSAPKDRKFDLVFPNSIAIDTEEGEDNNLISKIKKKGTYDILFNNDMSDNKTESFTEVKGSPYKKDTPLLVFPTVSNIDIDDKKPKPVVAPEDKYANYTLGYRKAQIRKSIEEGVEIKGSTKRLGIFDNAKSEADNAGNLETDEERERLERAKRKLYGYEDKTEPDRTFESLFISDKSVRPPTKRLSDEIEPCEEKMEDREDNNLGKSSFEMLYSTDDNKSNNIIFRDMDKPCDTKSIIDIQDDDLSEIGINNKNVLKEIELDDKESSLYLDKDNSNEWKDYDFNQDEAKPFGDLLNRLPENAPIRTLRSDIGRAHRRPNFMDTKIDAQQVSMIDSPTAVVNKTRYVAPPEELLKMYSKIESDSIDEHQERCIALRNVLMEYEIDTFVDRYTVGPSYTRYEITMPIGVTVKKIQSISDDIAMRLKASKIRIEAPIPGKNAVGIEIVNRRPSTVGMRDGIRSASFKKDAELSFLLGVSLTGEVFTCNIAKMPHLLIAGSTGAGKSVCINGLICSLLYKYSPDQVRLILIDPKRVELSLYNGLPHLLVPEIIFDPEKAINAINWVMKEMERRYEAFHNMRVRNLEEHNIKAEEEKKPTLPYILIIIDELADLMTYKKREIEDKIKRLAQLARAAGIHLVFATQRPSVDIITGTIKANFPSRIAFVVTSFADSKTILDHGGAEKLRGQGDMLYAPTGIPDPIRLQGVFISNSEVEAITDFVKEHNTANFDSSIEDEIYAVKPLKEENGYSDDTGSDDEYFAPALKLIIESDQASISMIQRRFAVGYARAARLIDEMELRGYIGVADGSKPRDVKISMEEYNMMYGDSD